MRTPESVIFTNMCMIYDNAGNVLVEDRVDPDWPGVTFPGGHVENGESFTDAAIREVFEETGVKYEIDRLAVIHENFFNENNGLLKGLSCFCTRHLHMKVSLNPPTRARCSGRL